MKEMNVLFYTTEEGGRLLGWPFRYGVRPTKEFLESARDPVSVQLYIAPGVRVTVHALVFEGGHRWDCVNGFGKEVPHG